MHRRMSSPRSWIKTSSSRTSITYVLKRRRISVLPKSSRRHILFSYLDLLTPNPAYQPIRTVENLGSFQFVSKRTNATGKTLNLQSSQHLLSVVISMDYAKLYWIKLEWIEVEWIELDWIQQTSSNPRNALYQSSLDASLERI